MDQLTLIHNIQDALRTPTMDAFFRTLNYVDTAWFLLILIPFACFFCTKEMALKVTYGVLFSSVSTMLLKMVFLVPRPLTVDPSVGLIHTWGYSFPSGGGQSAFWMGGLIIWRLRGSLGWTLGLLYLGLFSFSRVYLGVHYPTDLLGGWVVGACNLWFLTSPRGLTRLNSWAMERKTLYLALGAFFFYLLPGNQSVLAAFFLGSHLYLTAKEERFSFSTYERNETLQAT